MTKYLLIAFLLFLPNFAGATVYYADFTNGLDTNDGLSTTTPFQSINQFANNARSAGDILFVRRGQASTTNVTAVTFTSDGTLNNPISISADYDGLWPDDWATSTPTATLTFGSKFVALSASSTQLQTPNKWVYFQGDCAETYNPLTVNKCEFAYEVASTSPNGLDLYLPYRGNQSGSGINMRIASSAPQVGTQTEAAQIFTTSNDEYWVFKGLDIRSTNTTGLVDLSSSVVSFYDSIFQSDGTDRVVTNSTDSNYFKKIRTSAGSFAGTNTGGVSMGFSLEDAFLFCNGTSLTAHGSGGSNTYTFKNTEAVSCTNTVASSGGSRNVVFFNHKGTFVFSGLSGASPPNYFYFDDLFSTVGYSAQSSHQISSNTIAATTTISTTTPLRVGGGPKNLYVLPPSGTGSTGISTQYFPLSYIKLFEYPIYADTSSKTYTMYFKTASSSAFTVNPLTSTATGSSTPELYIECEYYADASDADRKLKRSNTASDVDFAGSTDWQDISVTCQPTQAGVLYLRGWYGKPREASTNQFYMDTTPVIQ